MVEPKLLKIYEAAVIIGLIITVLFLYNYMGTFAIFGQQINLKNNSSFLVIIAIIGLIYYLKRRKK